METLTDINSLNSGINFDNSSNPVLDELMVALSILGSTVYDGDGTHIDYVYSDLLRASFCASSVSNKFDNVNANISASWQGVKEFTKKIDDRVTTLVRDFGDKIIEFVKSTNQFESEIIEATKVANDLADSILKELGL